MLNSPIELASALTVGTVESVSPAEIKVLLELDAPQTTALNAGVPRGFPRINSYVLIPNEGGAVVGLIVWIGIERSLFPKRDGLKDFSLIDLPYPLRKMIVVPLGTLKHDAFDSFGGRFRLKRGVSIFPGVGDKVLLPTAKQLKAIVEVEPDAHAVAIGAAPLAENAVVAVDPNKLFGRHLAVLGNTGSGKSCTVAGLVRWSLEQAKKRRTTASPGETGNRNVNARFIILDPNGEYTNCFSDLGARVCKVQPTDSASPLAVPAWMWNSQEWIAFTSASAQSQKPALIQGLKEVKSGQAANDPFEKRLRKLMQSRLIQLGEKISEGAPNGRASNECGRLLEDISKEAIGYYQEGQEKEAGEQVMEQLKNIAAKANQAAEAKRFTYRDESVGYNGFNQIELKAVSQAMEGLLALLRKQAEPETLAEYNPDSPIPFDVAAFPDYLDQTAELEGGNAGFIRYLTARIRSLLADARTKAVIAPGQEITLLRWLEEYIGKNEAENGPITVIDLSLVPSDFIHLAAAVLARLIFEAAQRYRKCNHGATLPTVLVLEEAHTFVKRQLDGETFDNAAAQLCRETFERIAREGRKFGLGLVVSSQRPSELSPTILSQCNTYLLHRMVNDRDQELVGKLVPDNFAGLLHELPSLPSRDAVLLGWASPVPVVVRINELPDEQRPQSADPEYWEVWTGQHERKINWQAIADDWMS
jgi:DNA helicase HerA-like ATPase